MELSSEVRFLGVAATFSHKLSSSCSCRSSSSLPRLHLFRSRLNCCQESDNESRSKGGLKSALTTLNSYFDRLEAKDSSSSAVTASSVETEAGDKQQHSASEDYTSHRKTLQEEYALKEELLMTVLNEFEEAISKEQEKTTSPPPADGRKDNGLDLNNEETPPLVVLNKPAAGGDEVPLLLMRRGSLVVSTIVGINIGVYIFGLATSQQSETGMDLAFLQGAKMNDLILAGEWWRLITPTFLHAGFVHLFLSCWAMVSFGPLVESLYGSIGLVLIYFLGGTMGNVVSFFQTSQPTVGGTGAVFAVICSWIVFLAKNREAVRTFDTGELLQKVLVLSGLTVLVGNQLPLDAWSDVGGALVGVLFGAVASPRYETTSALQLQSSKTDLTLERLAFLFVLCSGALLYLYLLSGDEY